MLWYGFGEAWSGIARREPGITQHTANHCCSGERMEGWREGGCSGVGWRRVVCGSEAGGVRLTVRGEKWRESWLGVGGEEGRVKVTGEGGVRGREWGVGLTG